MTIAQRYAPGEAIARPSTLPLALIEARAAVFDPLNCLDLGTTARRVLFGILRFFNLTRPSSSIWPRRDLLRAESLLNSESSLYRGLADLERHGYVVREQIRIARSGRFHVSPVRLTEKAQILLGLVGRSSKEDRRQKVIHKEPSLTMEDGQYKEHTNEQKSLQNSFASEPPAGIDSVSKVPLSLAWLLKLGLTARAVFSLMSIAKRHGKRLEAIVTAFRERLSTLSGREAYAYIRSLAGKALDFAAIASGKEATTRAATEAQSAKNLLNSILAKSHGLTVVRRDGTSLGRIDAHAQVVMGRDGSLPLNLRFALAVQKGQVSIQRSSLA
ncbi:hypothetical protein D9X30_1786 [Cupriavidus sp. U2]|uniref:hypothetical protein n=1 Tax=Cupriavidus sp. U2 TaxID=2920269 RepID=UPI00129DD844|nr:hypothetical protein [Cupriavidus sp. U2]KAI3593237.1 hypothetical protein D9X30_1786 [Cupriavidus sp. U2]